MIAGNIEFSSPSTGMGVTAVSQAKNPNTLKVFALNGGAGPNNIDNVFLIKKDSVISSVNDLKGKLLIVHGYIDNTVVLQNSLSFIEECIKNGVQLDYFLYPTHEHNIPYGPDRVHLMKKVTQYFEDYLK